MDEQFKPSLTDLNHVPFEDEPLPPGVSMPPANDSEPTIFDALDDLLGLKLVRIKLPMDEIVIEHIEKPSPN